ncbi:MAG TPA: sulfite exporter TauE/SafE family protein [Chloroflexota bacterium]|nr:sulfite exporter TauE/SafE family protein [Chloroflexota bacterium]
MFDNLLAPPVGLPGLAVLAVLGALIAAYGTLIGSGGGFLLVPLLLFLYPNDPTGTITNMSLATVCVSSMAGTLAFVRLKRIDYRAGLLVAAASAPGSILGALASRWVPRGPFDVVFGALLAGLGLYLLLPRSRSSLHLSSRLPTGPRTLAAGLALATGIGFLASFFGIGGGVVQVPMLVQVMGVPVPTAAATSQLVLASQTLIATGTHILAGEYTTGLRRTAALAVGAVVGAPFGARLSRRLEGAGILRLLAVGLIVVGVRLLLPHG